MKQIYTFIIAFLLGGFTGMWLYQEKDVIDNSDYKEKLKTYRDEVARLNDRIDKEKTKVDSLTVELIELRTLAGQIEKDKKKVINYYEKKIADIDTFDISELDSFFTERYPAGMAGEANR